MAKYYYIARPSKWSGIKYSDLIDDEPGEWQEKARALQLRRWRALKRASKTFPKQDFTLKF